MIGHWEGAPSVKNLRGGMVGKNKTCYVTTCRLWPSSPPLTLITFYLFIFSEFIFLGLDKKFCFLFFSRVKRKNFLVPWLILEFFFRVCTVGWGYFFAHQKWRIVMVIIISKKKKKSLTVEMGNSREFLFRFRPFLHLTSDQRRKTKIIFILFSTFWHWFKKIFLKNLFVLFCLFL